MARYLHIGARASSPHLRFPVRLQRRRLALGPHPFPSVSGAARHRFPGLRFRPAPRRRCRPHRRDRQRHPQADAGRQAAGRRRLVLLARPFDRRRAGLGRDRADGRRRSKAASTRSRNRRHRSARSVSALFLLAIAVVNLFILAVGLSHVPQRARAAAPMSTTTRHAAGGSADSSPPVPAAVSADHAQLAHVPLGLLFGLGFDTATEIGLLGIAATRSGARACRSGRSWFSRRCSPPACR